MDNTSRTIAAPTEITSLGRWLAVAQQVKDTITILMMNIILIFGIVFGGIAVPGLVLYFLRWRLAKGRGTRTYALLLWSLGLLHEVLCAWLFLSADIDDADFKDLREFGYGYIVGIWLSLAGLVETLLNRQSREEPSKELPTHEASPVEANATSTSF